MFEYLKQLLKKAKQRKPDRPPTAEERLAKKLQPYESILVKIQEIVTWEEPSQSFLALCLVNLFFWFLSYVQWRFYGLLFSILCLIVIHEAWADHIWPEIRYVDPAGGGDASSRKSSLDKDEWVSHSPSYEGLLTVPEISHYATGLRAAVSTQYAKLQNLRRTDPQQYCALVSVGCIVAASVGSVVSGATLIYAAFMTSMCAPGVVRHLLSPEWKRCLFDLLTSLSSVLAPPDANIDMYVPEANRENLAYLQQAADNTDMSTPSTGSSSLADLLIPSHDESSLDTQDSFALSTIPQEPSNGSSSDDDLLQFKPTHFNGKESRRFFDIVDDSGGIRSRSRGKDDVTDPLLLNDLASEIDRALEPSSSSASGLKDVVTSALYRTFPKAFTSAKPTFSPVQNDSDSDFEIIENEED